MIFAVLNFLMPARFLGVQKDMSSGDGADNPLGGGPMDPREFEKKTQDELDDILNRCVTWHTSRGIPLEICERVFPCMA